VHLPNILSHFPSIYPSFASPRLCVPPFLCVSASSPLRLRASACPLSSASPRLLLCVSAPLRALFPLRLRVSSFASPRLCVPPFLPLRVSPFASPRLCVPSFLCVSASSPPHLRASASPGPTKAPPQKLNSEAALATSRNTLCDYFCSLLCFWL
jgi:hypothetical protein